MNKEDLIKKEIGNIVRDIMIDSLNKINQDNWLTDRHPEEEKMKMSEIIKRYEEELLALISKSQEELIEEIDCMGMDESKYGDEAKGFNKAISMVKNVLTTNPQLACEKHSRILIGKSYCVDCKKEESK